MKEYNGHRSWNAWNVSLWIDNTESIYLFAQECINNTSKVSKRTGAPISRERRAGFAAAKFMKDYAGQHTPDGAKYNQSSVFNYMLNNIEEETVNQ